MHRLDALGRVKLDEYGENREKYFVLKNPVCNGQSAYKNSSYLADLMTFSLLAVSGLFWCKEGQL